MIKSNAIAALHAYEDLNSGKSQKSMKSLNGKVQYFMIIPLSINMNHTYIACLAML